MTTTRIREIRKERGLTQADLAELTGWPQTFVSQMERPGYQPRIQTLERVAKALRCEIADLIAVAEGVAS